MTFQEAIKAIHQAAWDLNYNDWCKRAGFAENDYSIEKWQQWHKLNEALAAFDLNTLERIVTS
jgi:hypothetical protein